MVKTIPKVKNSQSKQQNYMQSIINAANEGCLLHQLYLDELINEPQFQAGLAFAKLYSLAMRSFGIHNRIRTASQSWDDLHGMTHDSFSNRKIESIWRYILKSLDQIYHANIPMRDIAFNLVLIDEPTKKYTMCEIKKTLDYLQTIWGKIETSKYKLGLFVYEENPIYLRLH